MGGGVGKGQSVHHTSLSDPSRFSSQSPRPLSYPPAASLIIALAEGSLMKESTIRRSPFVIRFGREEGFGDEGFFFFFFFGRGCFLGFLCTFCFPFSCCGRN